MREDFLTEDEHEVLVQIARSVAKRKNMKRVAMTFTVKEDPVKKKNKS